MHACMHNCIPNPHAWQTNYNSQLQTSVQSLEHPIPSVDKTSFSSYYSNTLDVYNYTDAGQAQPTELSWSFVAMEMLFFSLLSAMIY